MLLAVRQHNDIEDTMALEFSTLYRRKETREESDQENVTLTRDVSLLSHSSALPRWARLFNPDPILPTMVPFPMLSLPPIPFPTRTAIAGGVFLGEMMIFRNRRRCPSEHFSQELGSCCSVRSLSAAQFHHGFPWPR